MKYCVVTSKLVHDSCAIVRRVDTALLGPQSRLVLSVAGWLSLESINPAF